MKISGIFGMLIGVLMAASFVMAQDAAPAADKAAATPAAAPVVAPAVAPAAAPAVEAKAPAMPPPLELRKTGVVSVTKDASGKVAAIKLIVTSYDIVLNEASKALEIMDGQKVRVTGTFSMQDTKRCFTVKNVEPVATDEVKAPAAKPEAAAPAAAKPEAAAPAAAKPEAAAPKK